MQIFLQFVWQEGKCVQISPFRTVALGVFSVRSSRKECNYCLGRWLKDRLWLIQLHFGEEILIKMNEVMPAPGVGWGHPTVSSFQQDMLTEGGRAAGHAQHHCSVPSNSRTLSVCLGRARNGCSGAPWPLQWLRGAPMAAVRRPFLPWSPLWSWERSACRCHWCWGLTWRLPHSLWRCFALLWGQQQSS